MPNVIKITDQSVLVPTKDFPYAKWPFKDFNPVQSRLLETYDKEANIAIAAATSAGKTVCAEMYMSYEVRKRGGKALYIGPLKALAKEKEQDWTGKKRPHHFNDLATSICTGDYRITKSRIDELDASDLIVMTPEMLASRIRNHKSEKSRFLQQIGTAVIDECFSEDTLVCTEIGYLPIGFIIDHRLQVRVASHNFRLNKVEFKKIVGWSKKSLKRKWYSVVYSCGEICVTENQLIFVDGKGYVPASRIRKGDYLYAKRMEIQEEQEPCSFNRVGEERCSRHVVRRWVASTDRTEQDGCTVEDQPIDRAGGFCRVEVQSVEEIGWNPAANTPQWWLGERSEKVHNVILPGTQDGIRGHYGRQSQDRESQVAGTDNSSDCLGDVVYGRWESSSQSYGDAYREFYVGAELSAAGLAAREMECGCEGTVIQKLLQVKFFRRRAGQVSEFDTRMVDPRDGVQADSDQSSSSLQFLWQNISDQATSKNSVQEMPLLRHQRLQEGSQKVLLCDGEESTCCDLEIEDNGNFYVMRHGSKMPILAHNSHLLTVPNRGDHIEIAMMKLAEINPNCRFVLLSATMPNVDEICGWTSKLTGRDTYYLESDYRPCPLNVHYECYYDGDSSYDAVEAAKVGAAAGIVEYYSEDKFLVFVHTKRTGQMMVKMLNRCGIEAEFHNADLDMDSRMKLEDRFKDDKNFKVVVATPTLAWGVNLPARRVIIVGVHRGLERVENYNIRQEIGRSGRVGLDPQGDAYILVPESTKKETIAELKKVEPIRSTLLIKEAGRHNKTLAFHAVSEIFYRNITTQEGFHKWFERTLAHYQDQDFDDAEIDNTISLLQQYKAVKVDEEGEYECTPVGKIASLFYYSPFDVSDLRRNFHFLFESKKEENDYSIAMALGNIDSFRWGVSNRNERREMAGFQLMIERMYGKGIFSESAIKTGFAYYNMLLGKNNVPAFHAIQAGLYSDLDRTMEVMHAVNSMATIWGRKGYFDGLQIRLKYGVTSDLVELCSLPNVGQARAKKLKAVGLKSAEDVMSQDPATLAKIMKCNVKFAEEAVEGARKLIARRLVE